jgi:hypothetical protein
MASTTNLVTLPFEIQEQILDRVLNSLFAAELHGSITRRQTRTLTTTCVRLRLVLISVLHRLDSSCLRAKREIRAQSTPLLVRIIDLIYGLPKPWTFEEDALISRLRSNSDELRVAEYRVFEIRCFVRESLWQISRVS